MISEAEIVQIVNEIHQYDLILMELKDGTIFGIREAPATRLAGVRGGPRLHGAQRGA